MDTTIEQRFSKIKYFLKCNNWIDFSEKFDVPNQIVLNYRKERVKIPNDFLLKLEDFNINPDWLVTGKGEMLLGHSSDPKICKKGVPFYDIDVSASIVSSLEDMPESPEYCVDFKPLNDCTAYLPIYGESMYPKFASGEIIAVKLVKNRNIILWGEPYLVITDADANNLRTIKLLFPHPSDKSLVILRACNPAFIGDTIIPIDNIINIFSVKGKITRFSL